MQQKKTIRMSMAWLSAGATVVTVLLRAWLLPGLRDWDTGLFASGWLAIIWLLLVLVALAILGFLGRGERVEITSPMAFPLSVSALLSGGLLLVCHLWDGWLWLSASQMPIPQAADTSAVASVSAVLQLLFGALGAAALIRLGLVLLAEGRTRRGIAGWSMLLPVAWMWFRLARYEMSYVSAVRLSQSFFDVGMFVLELLFLFQLARFTAGVGKSNVGLLSFFSGSTAVFALSAPLVRLGMYLLGDGPDYQAIQLAGLPDIAVGVLALAVAFSLSYGAVSEPSPAASEDSLEDSNEA